MKIKQSFIERCREVTIKEAMAIATLTGKQFLTVINALLEPEEYNYTTDLWKATANVLKIDLSDIYEVEPNTLTE